MKKCLAFICLGITILCFLKILHLAYSCFDTYRHLQEIQTSGSEYFPLFLAPGIFAAISMVAVVAYSLYKKLTIGRFVTAGVVCGAFVMGVLIMVTMLVWL